MNNILILKDYRGFLYSSVRKKDVGIRLENFCENLKKLGYGTEVKNFSEVNFKNNYSGWGVIYQSQEDEGLYYKSFIEDIILGLKMQGAILLPEFHLFRAHHNKVFMEVLRQTLLKNICHDLNTRFFGAIEELNEEDFEEKSHVIKSAEGAGSKSVFLAHDKKELVDYSKKVSRNFLPLLYAKETVKNVVRNHHIQRSMFNKKFIIQDFIPDLEGDHKVLVFGKKFYVLKRSLKKGDFRASGSGILEFFPEDYVPTKILDFAHKIFAALNSPILSVDIALKGNNVFLVEFQCLQFGTLTQEKAEYHYVLENDVWCLKKDKKELEEDLAIAFDDYINRNEL